MNSFTLCTLLALASAITVTSQQLVPTTPQSQTNSLTLVDCLKQGCKKEVYIGRWVAIPKTISTGCNTLKYVVKLNNNNFGRLSAKKVADLQLNPATVQHADIVEFCARNGAETPQTADAVSSNGHAFSWKAKFTASRIQTMTDFKIEKVWIRNERIVAAAVTHGLFNDFARALQMNPKYFLTTTKSLWVFEGLGLSDGEKNELLALV